MEEQEVAVCALNIKTLHIFIFVFEHWTSFMTNGHEWNGMSQKQSLHILYVEHYKQTKQLVNVSISYHAKPGACDAFLNLYELQKVSAIHYDAKKSRSVVAAIKSINIKPAIYQIDHTIIILHMCSLFNILLRLFCQSDWNFTKCYKTRWREYVNMSKLDFLPLVKVAICISIPQRFKIVQNGALLKLTRHIVALKPNTIRDSLQ